MYLDEKLKEIMRNEAISALTKKPITTYSAERVRLWCEACDNIDQTLPQPIQMGLAMKYFCQRISIPTKPYDLLIGRMTEESFDEIQEEEFRAKYISQKMRYEGIPKAFFDGGHCSFVWEDIVRKGLPAMRDDAINSGKTMSGEQKTFVDGAVMIYDALICFITRCADAAKAAGLSDAESACREVANGAPKNFRSALQLIWSIEFFFCAYISPNPTLTIGRLDRILYKYYEADITNGSLSEDFAELLICDFYAKNNLIMGRGEHQISGRTDSRICTGWHRILCYDAPQYLILSGTDPDTHEAVANKLTELFLRCIEPKYKNPVIVFRYTKDFAKNHEKLWAILIEKMRLSGSIMIYNDISVCDMYKRSGMPTRDAESYELYGCNWPTIPGKERPNYNIFHSLDRTLIPQLCDALREYAESHDVFSRDDMLTQIYYYMRDLFKNLKADAKLEPDRPNSKILKFYSCFSDQDIAKGGIYYPYYNLIIPMGGIGTMIDIVCAIDNMSQNHNISAKELFEICDKNFDGYPAVLARCKNSPKCGDSSPVSAYYAKALTQTIINAVRDGLGELPSNTRIAFCAEQDTWHIEIGKSLPATPDGRKAGEPISQNSQPSVSAAKDGITAMLSCLSNIPFNEFASGALNVSIQPKNFEGEKGLANLMKIFEVYMERGGLQLQVSAVDKELLLDAQAHPGNHRDLMVRVTGYSAVFVDMCKAAQDDLISRNTF